MKVGVAHRKPWQLTVKASTWRILLKNSEQSQSAVELTLQDVRKAALSRCLT